MISRRTFTIASALMITCMLTIAVALAITAPHAAAHDDAAGHAAHAGQDQAAMPPVVGGGGGGAQAAAANAATPPANANAANAGNPAPGAQPAAPENLNVEPNVVEDPARVDPAAAEQAAAAAAIEDQGGAAAAAPNDANAAGADDGFDDLIVQDVAIPVDTVDGGGTDRANAGGGAEAGPARAGANAPAPAGNLPFTGIEETMLLIALAGMFAPIGVLLYCGANRGDRTRRMRHLAAPRFQWANSPGHHLAASPPRR